MKEEHQEEVGEEYYAANTGTLDSFLSKIKLPEVNNNYDHNNTRKLSEFTKHKTK